MLLTFELSFDLSIVFVVLRRSSTYLRYNPMTFKFLTKTLKLTFKLFQVDWETIDNEKMNCCMLSTWSSLKYLVLLCRFDCVSSRLIAIRLFINFIRWIYSSTFVVRLLCDDDDTISQSHELLIDGDHRGRTREEVTSYIVIESMLINSFQGYS